MGSDLRFTWRTLRRSPAFAIAAILTLALGIGANTAMFSILYTLLVRPLPYPHAEKLFELGVTTPQAGSGGSGFSYVRGLEMRDAAQRVEVAAYATDSATITGVAEPEPVRIARVTANFTRVIGVAPARGRAFRREEEKSGDVAIISHRLAERRSLGQTLELDGRAYTIVGVLPPGFALPRPETDAYLPGITEYPRLTRVQIEGGAGYVRGWARLGYGVSPASAQAELNTLNQRYLEAHPNFTDAARPSSIAMTPVRELEVGDLRPSLYLLGGAVSLVLLIAAANVANLFLARTAGRERELAIRTALGASRWHIIRQGLAENLMLYAAAAIVGALFAAVLLGALPQWRLFSLPRATEFRLDGRALTYAASLATLLGLLFGMLPAWRMTSARLKPMNASQRGLVTTQVALSMMLLLGAGLLLRSLFAVQKVDPGFDANGVWSFRLDTRGGAEFVDRLSERLRAIPGVEAVSFSSARPLGAGLFAFISVEGRPAPPPGERPVAAWQTVTEDYFRSMRIPLRRGRWFEERDRENAPRVAVINETMAKQFFANEDPVGQRIQVGRQPSPSEIIGVVADVRNVGLEANPRPCVYSNYRQWARPSIYAYVRTKGEPERLAAAARAHVAALDRNLAMIETTTLAGYVSETLGPRRLMLWLLGGFAALALLLAAIGIFGVVAYSVTQRTREIGIRRALGAPPVHIFSLVIGQSLRLTAIGVAAGLVGSLALKGTIAGLLYGVPTTDTLTYILIPVVFLATSALASAWPAWRASRIDPLIAMRTD